MNDRKQLLQAKLAANRSRRKADRHAGSDPHLRRELSTLLGDLQAECQVFQLIDVREEQDWVPHWAQGSVLDTLFRYAPNAAEWHNHVRDPEGRRQAIVELLGRAGPPEQAVLLIYPRESVLIRFSRATAQRFVSQAIRPGAVNAVQATWDSDFKTTYWTGNYDVAELWYSDPKGAWIVRSEYDFTDIIVREPPEPWTYAELREGRLCLEQVRRALIERRVRYRLVYPPLDKKPWVPWFRVPNWKQVKPALSSALPEEPEQQRALIGGFLLGNLAPDEKVLIRANPAAPAVPRIRLSAQDLADHVDAVVDAAGECLIHAEKRELVISIGRKWVYGVADGAWIR